MHWEHSLRHFFAILGALRTCGRWWQDAGWMASKSIRVILMRAKCFVTKYNCLGSSCNSIIVGHLPSCLKHAAHWKNQAEIPVIRSYRESRYNWLNKIGLTTPTRLHTAMCARLTFNRFGRKRGEKTLMVKLVVLLETWSLFLFCYESFGKMVYFSEDLEMHIFTVPRNVYD